MCLSLRFCCVFLFFFFKITVDTIMHRLDISFETMCNAHFCESDCAASVSLEEIFSRSFWAGAFLSVLHSVWRMLSGGYNKMRVHLIWLRTHLVWLSLNLNGSGYMNLLPLSATYFILFLWAASSPLYHWSVRSAGRPPSTLHFFPGKAKFKS